MNAWTHFRPLLSLAGLLPSAALIGVFLGALLGAAPWQPALAAEERLPFRKPQFLRGDSNADARVDLADAIHGLAFLFAGGPNPPCHAASDSNGDRSLDLSDGVYTLSFLFLAGPAPPPPGPRECGVDPAEPSLSCEAYPHCPDDLPLIAHVLGRITFGANEELYSSIQTRRDLVAYIEEQLQAPASYDPAVHEPQVAERVAGLGIGPDLGGNAGNQVARLNASTLVFALESRWQLLQVVAQFWNNHFHSQVEALRENFFSQRGLGGPALGANETFFRMADADSDGRLVQTEWDAFQALHPGLITWAEFGRRLIIDGIVTLEEFETRNQIAFWKYASGADQVGIAGQMELRDASFFRRQGLGRFRDLVEGTAKGVPMLIYLNGFENTAQAANENFAREILELHTVGVDNGYTQRDIQELARLLTGWSVGWVERAPFNPASDPQLIRHPNLRTFPLNLREPRPVAAPTRQFWEDALYTWAFVVNPADHDWARKDLFLPQYGGTDSLGNPLPAATALQVPANTSNRTVAGAVAEFDDFLDRLMSLRDCRKTICAKLIQLFVTDELNDLAREAPAPAEVLAAFRQVDRDQDGRITRAEWEEPVPLVLPAGRPPEKFDDRDADLDGVLTLTEYREPDLLLEAMARWDATRGDLRQVLRVILLSPEFLSLKFHSAKVKTPLEQVTSTLRILDASASDAQLEVAASELSLAGMDLYLFADPTGESELGFDWIHTTGLLERIKWISRGVYPENRLQRRFDWSPASFLDRNRISGREAIADFFIGLIHPQGVLPEDRLLALQAYDTAATSKLEAMVAFLLSIAPALKQ